MNRTNVVSKISLYLILFFVTLGVLTAQAGGEPPGTRAESPPLRGNAEKAAAGWQRIQSGALLIDVRSADEFDGGHIEGAVNIPHSDIDALAAAIGADTDRSVVLYCGSGRRAERAREQLESLGYSNIYNASGLDALEATRPPSP